MSRNTCFYAAFAISHSAARGGSNEVACVRSGPSFFATFVSYLLFRLRKKLFLVHFIFIFATGVSWPLSFEDRRFKNPFFGDLAFPAPEPTLSFLHFVWDVSYCFQYNPVVQQASFNIPPVPALVSVRPRLLTLCVCVCLGTALP
jgi:hypothetical protein